MTNRLNNKVALITGASSGIGKGISELFAKENCSIILTDKNINKAKQVCDEIAKFNPNCVALDLDVTSEQNWIEVIKEANNYFDRINILVNNAGIYSRNPVEKTELNEFEKIIKVNLNGTFLGTKHVIPEMRKKGNGSIINMSSTAGLVGNTGSGAYGASKGGIKIFTKYTALQHAHENIRVNSVHPGPINTDMISENLSTQSNTDKVMSKIPLKRIGTVNQVSMGVLFLASDESSYITGAELVIDGGLTSI